MSNIIILEYLTSKSKYDLENKKIFSEAISLIKSVVRGFLSNDKLERVIIVQNSQIEIVRNNKTENFYTNTKKSLSSVLKKLPKYPTIFIAPEIRNISYNFQKKLERYLPVFHSHIEVNKILSSKFETMRLLKEKNINHLGLSQKKNSKKYIIKSIYGTGSVNLRISKYYHSKHSEIVQDFQRGTKGSFLMLCSEKNFILVSCNKQIVKISHDKIEQIGLIIGGLESEREQIEILAKKIFTSIKGLFGLIGVDIIKIRNEWHVIEINPRFTSSFVGLLDCYDEDTIYQVTNLYLTKKLIIRSPQLKKKKRYFFYEIK